MNQLSTTAEAVKVAIDAADAFFAPAVYTVQRCFVPPDYNTAADRALKVFVIGFEEDVDRNGPNSTRSRDDHVYGVHVAIMKRLTAADVTAPAALAELDALSDVREKMIDFLKANKAMGDCLLDTLKNSPAAYDPPTLDQKKTFVSVIAATYRTLR